MKLIKLNWEKHIAKNDSIYHDDILVNPEHIFCLYRNEKNGNTIIRFDYTINEYYGNMIEVTESLDEIEQLIKKTNRKDRT